MIERIDSSNCVRYRMDEDVDTASQRLISWLSDGYPEIYLIQRESYAIHDCVLTRLTLFHRYWGPNVMMDVLPVDSTQTLILLSLPPDPDMEDVISFEDKILEYLPDSSASIRLARLHGNDARVLSLICTALRGQRHHCWMHLLSGLTRSLQLELYEGDPNGLVRDIPTDNRDIDQVEFYPSQDQSLVLDLWVKGYTAKQIALRTGRTEKTILNRVALMRKHMVSSVCLGVVCLRGFETSNQAPFIKIGISQSDGEVNRWKIGINWDMDSGISLQVYKRHTNFSSGIRQEHTNMSRILSAQRVHLPHQVIVKAPGLLPMLYTVRELSEDLGMPERTLRDWLKSGAPHTWDARQRIWINGQEFDSWVVAQRRQRRRVPLADDEAYCLRCKQAVKLHDPVTIPVKAKLVRIQGTCPTCLCVINRGGRVG